MESDVDYFLRKMELDIDYHIQDEAKRLLKDIELMMKNVDNSEMYAGMRFDLERNQTFQQHLVRVLGSYSHVQVVIYALGSIESSYHSMFQLAVFLLLKRDFSEWIDRIQVYDPVMSPADIIVFKELDLEVLTINENCRRQVQRPTLFYMPCPNYYHIGNLLGANWSSSCINQICLLTNSFRDALTYIPQFSWNGACNLNGETVQRLERILDFTTEIHIKTSNEKMYANVFSGYAWHFFDVDPNLDMETSVPVTEIIEDGLMKEGGCSWLDKQRSLESYFVEDMESDLTSEEYAQIYQQYRRPRRLRCKSVSPLLDWIKLNIYGIGTEGDQPGRYSGVFKDETGMCLGRYSGTTHVEDSVIAGLEALRHRLIRCVEGRPNAQKLILESDNVILVQYVNGCPEPNEITMYKLKEIFDLLERITVAVYHVYEEANEAARD